MMTTRYKMLCDQFSLTAITNMADCDKARDISETLWNNIIDGLYDSDEIKYLYQLDRLIINFLYNGV